ncbi:MAG: DUF4011 domain-containing protein [Thermoguttaceae bacterium]
MSIADSIEKQIQDWRSKLLDLSKRNSLLNCRSGDRGAVEVKHPTSDVFWNDLLLEEKEQTLVWRSVLLDPPDAHTSKHHAQFSSVSRLPKTRKRLCFRVR